MNFDNRDNLDEAKNTALGFLGRRLRTEREVRIKLSDRFSENVINEVIKDLKRVNLINDDEYVGCFVRDRLKLNPWGKNRIKLELEKRGICPEVIENNQEFQNINEEEIIKHIILKKHNEYNTSIPAEDKKLRDLLYRRGFDPDNINNTLKQFRGRH